MECVSLYIDESGNFGSSGRYFTLASLRCIDHSNFKLNRAVKKASLKFWQMSLHPANYSLVL